ncbi:MAG: acyl-CoA carboxylase subunit beta [Ignavibacteria bacterium]|nr:acyl-CoA carboxylase subunit beta [Ignavibacteria bacterium]
MKKLKKIQKDVSFFQREDHHKNLLRIIHSKEEKIKLGGGKSALESHLKKGKMFVRDRINKLIDPGTKFFEIGIFTGHEMYDDYIPAAGTVVGIGKVSRKLCVIVANDATVKAGAWFPITCKKNLRAQEISIENKLPIIYLVDSAGVFLPMQEEIFPDKEHFGRIFRNNAVMSAMGIPQISAIMGPCVAGGAYLPIMSDEALIVEGTGSVFLAGSHLVKAAIGENIDNEQLGGADVHCSISGVTDYKVKNDEECINQIRGLIDKISGQKFEGFDRVESKPPINLPSDVLGIFPADTTSPYDMYDVLSCIVDDGDIDEYKENYGKTLITCYARIDGWAVGIVANQRLPVKSKSGEIQIGGVIYSDSADKATRFIMNCNQKKVPLIFFQDVTGFMVGSRAEHGGIIKDGAKLVNAVANCIVPKFTFIVGNSYGAGNYGMCGKAYDPRLIFSFPNSLIAVMGGAQASNTLLNIRVNQLAKEGKKISEDEKQKLLNEIQTQYGEHSQPIYAASRLWVDGIVNPSEVREIVSLGIETANHSPITRPFITGVIQT